MQKKRSPDSLAALARSVPHLDLLLRGWRNPAVLHSCRKGLFGCAAVRKPLQNKAVATELLLKAWSCGTPTFRVGLETRCFSKKYRDDDDIIRKNVNSKLRF